MPRHTDDPYVTIGCRLRLDQIAVLRQISRALGLPVSEQSRAIDQWLAQYADRITPERKAES
jgi:hypothetical protein